MVALNLGITHIMQATAYQVTKEIKKKPYDDYL